MKLRLAAAGALLAAAAPLLADPSDFGVPQPHGWLGTTSEWMRDKYDERLAFDQAGPLADFNGNRYFVGVHWRP